MTFSLLPDFLAAGVKGSLAAIAEVAAAVEAGPSVEAVASALRPDVGLVAAVRWVQRREVWFAEGVTVARGVLGELRGVQPVPSEVAEALGVMAAGVLGLLRIKMAPCLGLVAHPTGLCPRWLVRALIEGRINRIRGQRSRPRPP